MKEHEHSHFAHALNGVLTQTSKSAEELVSELNKHGFPLPLHTFNYWLQGYFLPRSDSAFQLVAILENICGITDNGLSDALLRDLSSGASFVPGESAQSDLGILPFDLKEKTRFTTVADKAMDWEANLIQKAVRDECYVSGDYKYIRHKATALTRVPAVPNPTFVFQIIYAQGEEPGSDGQYFSDLSGIKLKKQEVFEEDGMTICATQFALPDDVVPGDLHRLSYSWDFRSDVPFKKVAERFFPWTLDFYSCKVTFEGGVPEDIRYITYKPIDNQEIEVPCDFPMIREGNTVSISAKKFGNLISSFSYTVPAI